MLVICDDIALIMKSLQCVWQCINQDVIGILRDVDAISFYFVCIYINVIDQTL